MDPKLRCPEPATHPPERDERTTPWLFAYGSLLWRPGFEPAERRRATLPGYARRFWQRSTDHRGTEDFPGRVVTLHPEPGGQCEGLVWRVAEHERARVLAELDVREKNGYARRVLPVRTPEDNELYAVVYVADEGNDEYAGPESDESLAARVLRAHGPSGPNREYVLRLAAVLRELGVHDAHVFALEALVLAASDGEARLTP